jgi:RHS repeat-associated protein
VSSENLPDHITDGTNTRHFTWTANGNMATDDRTFVGGGAAAFTFGGRNLLESMTVNSQGITYKINGLGQRVSEAFSGSTTHYIHDVGGNVIAEADGSTGTTTVEYVWLEGELLAQVDGSGNIVYVHNSHIGAPQKITNPSRTLVWDQIREPFGEVSSTPTSTTPTNWRFLGQYANSNNSLSHNGARDYDPSCACYVESDPIGLAGGLNPLSYAMQNPVNNIDPAGLDTQVTIGIGGTGGALLIGGGGSLSGGINIPDDPRNVLGYQIFVTGQAELMAGAGGYLGAGIQVGISHTDGPLPSGLSTGSAWYSEADFGWGPSIGGSVQGSTPPCDGNYFSSPPAGASTGVPVLGKYFVGGGLWLGVVGETYGFTYASPTVGQYFLNRILP